VATTDKQGWYEVQLQDGAWFRIDGFQAAALRLDNVPVRYMTKAIQNIQALNRALEETKCASA
jgi:hypothetical protein